LNAALARARGVTAPLGWMRLSGSALARTAASARSLGTLARWLAPP